MSDDRLSRLESRLDALESRLGVLEHALREDEHSFAPRRADPAPVNSAAAAEPYASAPRAPANERVETPDSGTLPLIGRTLLVIGGAFLLRAVTDAGALPASAGVTLGVLYGLFWLFRARRDATRGIERGVAFHGAASALVVFPLLVESTLKFQILSVQLAAILLPVLWLAGMLTAYVQRIRSLAWIFSVSGGITGVVLTVGSGFYPPLAFTVLGMALGGLWLGYLRGWNLLAVVGSGVADFIVVATTILYVLRPDNVRLDHLTPTLLFTLQLGLILLYLASYLVRALVQKQHVSVLEILQALTAFFIGTVGALYLTRVEPRFALTLGIFSAAIGVLCYAMAFLYIDHRAGRRRNFAFFTSSAVVATLVGATLLLDGAVLTAFLLIGALAAAGLGAHHGRATLSLHGAAYVVAASASSHLLGLCFDTFVGAPAPMPDATTLGWMFAVVIVALICSSAHVVTVGPTWGHWSRTPKVIDLLVLGIGIGGLFVFWASRLFMGPEGAGFDAGAVAALRTGTLSVGATALGALSLRSQYREAARLVPIFLALGALTLALGDLRAGRPFTLVFSLVLYGGALILAPRLARSARRRPAEAV